MLLGPNFNAAFMQTAQDSRCLRECPSLVRPHKHAPYFHYIPLSNIRHLTKMALTKLPSCLLARSVFRSLWGGIQQLQRQKVQTRSPLLPSLVNISPRGFSFFKKYSNLKTNRAVWLLRTVACAGSSLIIMSSRQQLPIQITMAREHSLLGNYDTSKTYYDSEY